MTDPARSVGLSPGAAALRIATEDLIAELHARRPRWSRGGARAGIRRPFSLPRWHGSC